MLPHSEIRPRLAAWLREWALQLELGGWADGQARAEAKRQLERELRELGLSRSQSRRAVAEIASAAFENS